MGDHDEHQPAIGDLHVEASRRMATEGMGWLQGWHPSEMGGQKPWGFLGLF